MKIFGYEISRVKAEALAPIMPEIGQLPAAPEPDAAAEISVGDTAISAEASSTFWLGNDWSGETYGTPGYITYFNGEKNAGNLGNPSHVIPDRQAIRMRAHKFNLESDLVKIITGKFFKWVVGNGLKLQAEPNEYVLNGEGVPGFDPNDFRANHENYWGMWSESTRPDHSGEHTLGELAELSFNHSFIGGDMLNILRLDENMNVTLQVVDGQHVRSPFGGTPFSEAALESGNVIREGVEIDSSGRHIAYYVNIYTPGQVVPKMERVLAKDPVSGCRVAWLTIISKHRADDVRGISNLAHILEKVAKADRYAEASVSRAEETAKVSYAIEHDSSSDGENPLLGNIGRKRSDEPAPIDIAEQVARRIQATEEKQVYNLPIGSKLAPLNSSTGEINFPAFFQAIFDQLCASQDIPPEVATQKYSSNYSASRAAINGWGYIINYYRKKFASKFYKNVYQYWQYVHVLKGKVKAPGYLKARTENNQDVIEAYSSAKWSGPNMPHLDPLKEVNAIRTMLGDSVTPLASYEQAAEMLNLGDWLENYKKYLQEHEQIQQDKQPKAAAAPATIIPEEDDTNDKTEE